MAMPWSESLDFVLVIPIQRPGSNMGSWTTLPGTGFLDSFLLEEEDSFLLYSLKFLILPTWSFMVRKMAFSSAIGSL